METIHADERAALLKALERSYPSDLGLTIQQHVELKSVLADGTIRLLMRPKEKSFSVPVRVQVLAADELDATNVVESLLNGGISGSEASDSVVGWLINHKAGTADEEEEVPRPFSHKQWQELRSRVAVLENLARASDEARRRLTERVKELEEYRTSQLSRESTLRHEVVALQAEVRILRDPRLGGGAVPSLQQFRDWAAGLDREGAAHLLHDLEARMKGAAVEQDLMKSQEAPPTPRV